MHEASVPGFRPSAHGFHFANRWPAGPTVRFGRLDPRLVGVGDAATGLCGGMVYTVADLYAAGIAVPADREAPANGSPRFRSVVRRQVQSLAFGRVPLGFWIRMAFGGSFGGDRARSTFEDEWPRAKRAIDRGQLVPIGLIRVASRDPRNLTKNHQVIAYGYLEDGRGVTLRIYDPNWPDNDDVTVTLTLDNALRPTTLSQSTGESLLGWFVLPYRAEDPIAWR